jgi:hypothetical protein
MTTFLQLFLNSQKASNSSKKMINGLNLTFRWICFSLLVFSFLCCAEWKYRSLESADLLTSTALRQNWNRYIVYYRPNTALLYKLKNDTRIELSGKWVEVAREDMVGDSTVFYLNDVREILGQTGELYGYIVHHSKDNAFIKIIDAKTVELIYVHQVQEGR